MPPMAMAWFSVTNEGSSAIIAASLTAPLEASASSKCSSITPMCRNPDSRNIAVLFANVRTACARSFGLLSTRSFSMRPTIRPSSASHALSGRICWKYRCTDCGTCIHEAHKRPSNRSLSVPASRHTCGKQHANGRASTGLAAAQSPSCNSRPSAGQAPASQRRSHLHLRGCCHAVGHPLRDSSA